MIYQSLEYSSEQDQIKLHTLFNSLLNIADSENVKQNSLIDKIRNLNDEKLIEDALWDFNAQGIPKMDSKSTSPKFLPPYNTAKVSEMIQKFLSGQRMHIRMLLEILKLSREALMQRPNIQNASTSISKKITVVGDLHGYLEDLSLIFFKNGFPDVMNPYVFNGDFVDRGPNGVETMCVLLCLFILNPTSVYLNRGNHEDHFVNFSYGFIKEINKKYKNHADHLMKCFADIFRWIPLATIIDNKIFVVHGGISNRVDLDKLNTLSRRNFVTLLEANQSSEVLKKDEANNLMDILWSDPRPQLGCDNNEFRGGGCYFGPDVTNKFLEKNNFSLIIRSHECKPEGFEWNHDDKVITIFSVSNYYSEGSNKGAYLVINDSHQIHPFQFIQNRNTTSSTSLGNLIKSSGSSSSSASQKLTDRKRLSSVEDMALNDLKKKIFTHKFDLMKEFRSMDPSHCGYISISQWCSALEKVLGLKLPWRTLKNRLVFISKDGTLVKYSTMFDEKKNAGQSDAIEQIYKHRDNLETLFRMIDVDASGKISVEEFIDACKKLAKCNLEDEDLSKLARSIDLDKDGQIDFNDFLEAFRIVDVSKN